MSDEQQTPQPIDPNRIGCRIVDVHSALQKAFATFAQSGDDSLDGLARQIHEALSDMPAFLMAENPTPPKE
jgi:hypothetical protein